MSVITSLMVLSATIIWADDTTLSSTYGNSAIVTPNKKPKSQVEPSVSEVMFDEQINWQVISAGGTANGSSDSYALGSTIGQTAVETGSSESYVLHHGFWVDFGGPCDCRPGDANGDSLINVGDVVYIQNYVFKGGPAPTPYASCSGDPNGDCSCNVGDAVYLINWIFKGGPPPVTCEEWVAACGLPFYK